MRYHSDCSVCYFSSPPAALEVAVLVVGWRAVSSGSTRYRKTCEVDGGLGLLPGRLAELIVEPGARLHAVAKLRSLGGHHLAGVDLAQFGDSQRQREA